MIEREAVSAVPPGPGGPAWGNFVPYLREPLATMDGFAEEYGGVVFVRFPGGHTFYFVGRMCIGERFAMLEGAPVLAAIARTWRAIPEGPAPQLDARFTLHPRQRPPARVRAA